MNATLDKLRLIGQLANRRNYEYSDEQVAAIFRAIPERTQFDKGQIQE